jgi:hypothetical protein
VLTVVDMQSSLPILNRQFKEGAEWKD